MRFVPRNRVLDAPDKALFLQYMPDAVAGFRPMPTGSYAKQVSLRLGQVRDEVDGQSVLMRTLPFPRFRNRFRQQVSLPSWAAECLEDVEAELRNAGLIKEVEGLVQLSHTGLKFRVQHIDVPVDDIDVHGGVPSVSAAPASRELLHLTEGPTPVTGTQGDPSRAQSEASLYGEGVSVAPRNIVHKIRQRRRAQRRLDL